MPVSRLPRPTAGRKTIFSDVKSDVPGPGDYDPHNPDATKYKHAGLLRRSARFQTLEKEKGTANSEPVSRARSSSTKPKKKKDTESGAAANYQQQLALHQQEMQAMQKKLEAVLSRYEETMASKTELLEKLSKEKLKSASFEKAAVDLRTKIAESAAEKQRLVIEQQEIRQNHEVKMQEIMDEMSLVTKEKQKSQKESAKTTLQLNEYQKQLSQSEKKLYEYRSTVKQGNKSLEQQLTTVKNENHRLLEDLTNLKEENSNLEFTNQRLIRKNERDIKKLEDLIQEKNQIVNRLQQSLADRELEFSETQTYLYSMIQTQRKRQRVSMLELEQRLYEAETQLNSKRTLERDAEQTVKRMKDDLDFATEQVREYQVLAEQMEYSLPPPPASPEDPVDYELLEMQQYVFAARRELDQMQLETAKQIANADYQRFEVDVQNARSEAITYRLLLEQRDLELQQARQDKSRQQVEVLERLRSTMEEAIVELQLKLENEQATNMQLVEQRNAELALLEKRHQFAYGEIMRLGGQNAQLLGHKNDKQRIRYVKQMQEENQRLKKDRDNQCKRAECLETELDAYRAVIPASTRFKKKKPVPVSRNSVYNTNITFSNDPAEEDSWLPGQN